MDKRIVLFIALLTILFSAKLLYNRHQKAQKETLRKQNERHLDLELDAKPLNKRAQVDSIVTLEYTVRTGANFQQPAEKVRIFVHIVDQKGEIVFQDDHDPDKNPAEWKKDSTYVYQRKIYIPDQVPPGNYRVLMGIYAPSNSKLKYFINGVQFTSTRYLVAELKLFPSAKDRKLKEYIVFQGGWFPEEMDAGKKWRWAGPQAEFTIPNFRKPITLNMIGVLPILNKGDQINQITIKVNDHLKDTFVPKGREFLYTLDLTTEDLGDQDRVSIQLQTSMVYIPALAGEKNDYRKLGVMVKNVWFE